ncbi:hypothetical protein NUM_16240 [Actinocatenispora comari]|uniref:Uncharacterized protein n=1 Tax=Actinocatenispora comari TaxID=2807577 RepID=A0A8J4A8W5_9ACTN|nr:hypothetical protein NUM_16240 [Actinocatenispora comari]
MEGGRPRGGGGSRRSGRRRGPRAPYGEESGGGVIRDQNGQPGRPAGTPPGHDAAPRFADAGPVDEAELAARADRAGDRLTRMVRSR